MSSEHVLSSVERGVMHLQLNRPDKKNALTLAMYTELAEQFKAALSNADIRVLLLSGSSACFTAGNDIADFVQNPPTGPDSPVFQFLQQIVHFPKPVVAAVQGAAVGIGTTLLMHCDLVYAGESAVFRMPFVNLGLCPEAASSYILPRMMGHVRAAELLMLGEKFDGNLAKEVGLINDVMPDEAVLSHAKEQASKLVQLPPASVRLTKSLMKQAQHSTLEETLSTEANHFLERLASPEAAEAFRAFAERRKPDFSKFQ